MFMLTHKHIGIIKHKVFDRLFVRILEFSDTRGLFKCPQLTTRPHEKLAVIREEAKTISSSMIAVPDFKLVD